MAATNDPISIPSLYLQDLDEVERVFNRFDTNVYGKISADELTAVMQTLGFNTSPEEVSKMTEEIDTDRDGFINLEEFAGFYKAGNDGVDTWKYPNSDS